jgi:tetratricopeptide (TPR) repeat protein
MRTAVVVLAWFLLVGAPQALAETARVLLGETRVLDGGVDTGRVDPNTFTSTLKFILGSDPALQVGDIRDGPAGTPVGAYRVTSSLQSLRESILWTGQMQRPDAVPGQQTSPDPIQLGPVTLADDKGLRAGALVEIVGLIKRQVIQGAAAPRRPVAIYTCLKPDASPLAREYAEEFRQYFAPQIKIADLIPVSPPPPCLEAIGPLPENTARVTGRTVQQDSLIVVEPVLEWKDSVIPLPVLRLDVKAGVDAGQAYVAMLSRATIAAFQKYPPPVLELLSAFATDSWQQNRARLSAYPYLTIAILQRRDVSAESAESRALHFYRLGVAFAEARELDSAKASFELSRQLRKDWIDPVRELGTLLFEFQRYDEAKVILEEALALDKNREDAKLQEKYAHAAYLLGNKDDARRELKALLEKFGSTASASAWLLSARLAIDDGNLQLAASQAERAHALAPGDRAVIERLAREITVAVIEKDAKTRADPRRISPTSPQEFQPARNVLDLLEPRSDDSPKLLALKGVVPLLQGLAANGKDPVVRAEATRNVAAAIGYYRQAAAAESGGDPEHELIQLDLAEALLFAAGLAPDGTAKSTAIEDSAKEARAFLDKGDPRGLGLVSFHPVAQFLITVGDYLLGRSVDPWSDLQSRIKDGAEAPSLFALVPTGKDSAGKGTSTRVLIAQWSFGPFRDFACDQLAEPQRGAIVDLLDRLMAKVKMPALERRC